jgi:predicted GIY-YIG superfamily endonuclease
MKFITLALVFQFLLACWPKLDIITKIKEQYGQTTLKLVRKLEKTFLKLRKVELDLIFLKNCSDQKLVPSFCKVKLANGRGLSQKELYALESKVLFLEIQVKHRNKAQLGKAYKHLVQIVRSNVSFITYISILKLIRSAASYQNDVVQVRHATKLSNLIGNTDNDAYFLDTDKIVVNLSKVNFSNTEVNILSRGLAYSIPPQQLNNLEIRTSFECFYRQLLTNLRTGCINRLKQRLKGLCYTYIYGYRNSEFHNLSKEELQSFKSLCKRRDVVFCKPDKGNGVVIMDKDDYVQKVQSLISDKKKFKLLKDDPTEPRESSLQKFLRYLKNTGAISEETLNKVRPCGSNPSRIYGLPKLHKPDVPLRPIVSGIGSYTHKLAKHLADILKPIATNKYTVKDSFTFTNDIFSLSDIPFMCSFDIVSLYTNIPVNETIDICLSKLFYETDLVSNLTKMQMKKLLVFCLKQNHFSFEGQYYDQIDGVAMGSPLGPILANIFMAHFEENALSKYTGNPPIVYKRYVDDIFLTFNDRDDCELFYDFLNCQHKCMKFTLEIEKDNSLAFLDVLVSRSDDGNISTSLYRKETFSGLYLKFDSFVPHHFKKNLVSGLLNRTWKICSSREIFNKELDTIKNLLKSNGFPSKFLNRQIQRFLRLKLSTNFKFPNFGPEKKTIFISLPFCGQNSTKLNRQLSRIIDSIAPWAKMNIVFKPSSRFQSLSKLKSVIPILNKSNVIYKINCKNCKDFYIGLTTRRLHKRLHEHKKRKISAIYRHASETGHSLNFENPEIIASDNIKLRLQIKETLQINQYAAFDSLNVNIESFECKLWEQ